MLKVSIITVSLNAENTIDSTIKSVLAQGYPNIQYIIVDGFSRDNTMEVVRQYANQVSIIVSEKDNGLYDAINKGILLADGEILGIVNADDVLKDPNIISKIADTFSKKEELMSVIGDIEFVNSANKPIRYYSANNWNPNMFRFGMMPPHPSFYCRRELFLKYGLYRTDFKIASDYELMLRFFKVHCINYEYLPITIVSMKLGGISTNGLASLKITNREIMRASRLNNFSTNYFFICLRYISKVIQLFFLNKKEAR